MNIKNFVLSYYQNSSEDFHIHKVEKTFEAQMPHTHDYFQVYFITKGGLLHFVENESSHLSYGDMFIIPPGIAHHISPEPDTMFYSFSFMPDFLIKQDTNNKFIKNFLLSLQLNKSQGIRPKVSIASEEIFYVENLMEHILKEFNQKLLGYYETIRAYAELLIMMIARSNYFEKPENHLSDHFENNKQFMLHCIKYIENNFTDQISLDEITKKSTMSKNNFCALFLKLTGYSFNNFLNICRIKKATEYIKRGYKITAIYGLCGYNDFSTFYRNFKKVMGISPQEYKKSNL